MVGCSNRPGPTIHVLKFTFLKVAAFLSEFFTKFKSAGFLVEENGVGASNVEGRKVRAMLGEVPFSSGKM